MLELRPSCEHCDRDLPAASELAMICSFECTFCRPCVDQHLGNVCPNCGGNLVARPIRPSVDRRNGNFLGKHPASAKRIRRPVDLEAHAKFRDALSTIEASQR